MKTKTKRTIGYVRWNRGKGVGIDAEGEIRRFCEKKHLSLTGIRADPGDKLKTVSGRPVLWDIIRVVDRREVDVVVVYALDHLSGDKWERLVLENLFLRRGVECWSVMEGSLTASQVGRELLQLKVLGKAIVKKDKRNPPPSKKKRNRAQYGEKVIGQKREFGKTVETYVAPNEEEKKVLELMLALKKKGMSCADIAKELNRVGLRMKTGLLWSRQMVGKRLKIVGWKGVRGSKTAWVGPVAHTRA